jgi:hypothetical protein
MKHFSGSLAGIVVLNAAIVLDLLAKISPPVLCAVFLTGALSTALLGARLLTSAFKW